WLPAQNEPSSIDTAWIKELARDLVANQSQSLIVAGRRQPAEVHALVFALNQSLGNIGKTVVYRALNDAAAPSTESLVELSKALKSGEVETLFILGGNPAYSAPADLAFDKLLTTAKQTIHFGKNADETGSLTTWQLPQSHYLESWGDTRSADGTASVIQPLIEPLFDSRNTVEMLSLITTGALPKAYDVVRE
ncbi:MAG: hypothetical protein CO167_04155, partial [Candidatus Marinimicrobia bacterium CG_4_9_14_3_um_filter_48_9]